MDLPHGLLWGEFIRVRDSGSEFWDGVHEITDTTQDELSFVVGEKSKIVNALSLSRPNPSYKLSEVGIYNFRSS